MEELYIPQDGAKRLVIVGGGFGGITLIKKLKNSPFQIVLIDKHNYHTFQPLLYQVATGGLEPDSIAYPIRHIFESYKNFFFRLAEVSRIDELNKKIFTNEGSLSYDYLVIATGSTSNFFSLAEVQKYALGMKSLAEALDIRSLILQNFEKAVTVGIPDKEKYLNIIIVGGGPTGVEIAGALAELKKHVLKADYPELHTEDVKIYLIESSSEILSVFTKRSSEKALEFLKNLGVQVLLNIQLKNYDGEVAVFSDGSSLPSKCVIWSAGVKGEAPEGLSKEHIGKGNRFQVDAYNRINNSENIFAIGDVALLSGDPNYPTGHPMVAQAAIQQAKLLAKNLISINKNIPLKPFRYKDLGSLATIGRNKAVVEFRFIKLRGIFAWFIWMTVHLMALVGFRNRIIVFINWVWNYFSYDRAIRLIVRPFKRP